MQLDSVVTQQGVGNVDSDSSGVGELQGVTQQIVEDLLQTQWIALQGKWQVCCPAKLECQLFFFGGIRKQGSAGIEQFIDGKGCVLKTQIAGLDFREDQNIIQDPQQG